jgi:2-polyprenyl-6-methoxyphenol hydroxylase-like FAD-dependent oxidoreductase
VLEKHGDFRGDTVHPSTLQLLDELGLGERFGSQPCRTAGRTRSPSCWTSIATWWSVICAA